MIGWLRGEKIEDWQQGTRHTVLMACGGVGYEVQIAPRHLKQTEYQTILTLWVHLVKRENEDQLFGFPEQKDRNLFRTLIGVNGVGPQLALALLEELDAEEIVQAILDLDIKKLYKAQGVGKKTAERIAVELRGKISKSKGIFDRNTIFGDSNAEEPFLNSTNTKDVQKTLEALGYEELEIIRALKAVAQDVESSIKSTSEKALSPGNTEEWLKASLRWLSKEAA